MQNRDEDTKTAEAALLVLIRDRRYQVLPLLVCLPLGKPALELEEVKSSGSASRKVGMLVT
jgi:hypothetical protein